MIKHYDLVIAGGGMVGASLACALLPVAQALQLKIALVELQPLPPPDESRFQPSYDARSTALAYGARSFYQATGVWQRLQEHLTPIEHIHVSDRGHFGATRLHAADEQVPALGYVVENHWLGQVLLDHIRKDRSGCLDFICPAEIESFTPGEGCSLLSVKTPDAQLQLQAELAVIADGGRSGLREALGISCEEHHYDQHALVANISLDRPHQQVAYERFTDSGPMALLPGETLDGEFRCGLVWTLPDEDVADVLALDDVAFLQQLQQTFGYRAGRFMRVGERYSYPLKLTLAQEQVRAGLVVLGNAAHALHPIAGQGYNLALRGVTDLAENLIASRQMGISLGDLARLQTYEQQRKADQLRTIGFSDKTMRLFSNPNPILSLGRSLGLQFLDICPLGKTLFARAAMGLNSPALQLPR
ncbi:2-octaprenyl-6-methoxyphenyl hydroxylase [Nitrincola iocasae]|uniref:2-octaprenyl-6-methoxyphenyl hydroxylase n=1 Tax=Nitrincola iocasae TaxID=2614693 RepID=A0A5J6L9Y7_9GAMM|nr:2-octaprenyl-6-methoxyphenyl hydroxylase [Nitrincola iocasae]QEW05196.1 2-octaprenyl-6-methoxyphenyl hydroxylase [Nitrincola iocasae]